MIERTSAQADADTVIFDAHQIQNVRQCAFGEALREACDGDIETIERVLRVIMLDTAAPSPLAPRIDPEGPAP